MAKVYLVPKVSNDLVKKIVGMGYCFERKSKDALKLVKMREDWDMSRQYDRYYTFHLDFENKKVNGMNINEYTSNYKRAAIWVKPEELEVLLEVEKELTALLERDCISQEKEEP